MTDLDTIMSGRSDESAPEQNAPQGNEPAIEQGNEGQPRDPHGRFAQPEQTPPAGEADPNLQQQRPPDGYIPIQALDARLAKQQERFDAQMRERDARFQQQLAAYQPRQPQAPVQPPDFFENPDAAFQHRMQQAVAPLQQGQQGMVENFSKMMAAEKFGQEAVDKAYSEMAQRMQSNPQASQFDYQRIMSSPHPYGELVKWHKAQSALQTYGDDPNAFIEAEIQRRMAAGGQQPNPAPQAQQPSVLPTSFSKARSAGPTGMPQWTGPKALSDIMNR